MDYSFMSIQSSAMSSSSSSSFLDNNSTMIPDVTMSSTDTMPAAADYYESYDNNDDDALVDETDYGYEDAFASVVAVAPSATTAATTTATTTWHSTTTKATRRSSLKQTAATSSWSTKHRRQRRRRRASLSYKGEIQIRLADKTLVRRSLSIGFCPERNQVHEIETCHHHENDDDDDNNKDENDLRQQQDRNMRNQDFWVVEYARRVGPDEMDRKQIHTRGLEPYIYKEESREKRQLALAAVLDEQYEQRCQGVYNEQSIGDAYANQSSFCQELAQIQADIDYAEVKTEHRNTRRLMMRRSSC